MGKNRKDWIDLINCEGALLKLRKFNENEFTIYSWDDHIVEVLDKAGIYEFIHGDMELMDWDGKVWKYSEQPGYLKPDLKSLDEFIGVDTTGKTY